MRIDGRKNRTVRGSLLHAAYGPPFTAMIVLAALSQACAQPDASNAAPVRSPLRSSKIDPPEAPTRSLASDVNRVRVIAGTTSAGVGSGSCRGIPGIRHFLGDARRKSRQGWS